jgi:hypothetical protein
VPLFLYAAAPDDRSSNLAVCSQLAAHISAGSTSCAPREGERILLHSVKELSGYTIEARDGHIGSPYEFCFDDQTWYLRYAVVDTGDWLLGHKIMISLDQFDPPEPAERTLAVKHTLQEVQDSPSIETNKPVYLQRKSGVYDYLGWSSGMHMSGTWLISPIAGQLLDEAEQGRARERGEYDPHLRSTREVFGYHIDATDGELGHIEDFIVDDQTWRIGYIVIDTHNWLPGKKVIVAPMWIVKVRWIEKKVYVALQRQTIENSPECNLEALRRENTELEPPPTRKE